MIGAQAAREYYTGHVDAFIGPVCNNGLVQLGYMASNWNLPIVSPRGNTRLIRNTTIFPTVISLHPFGKFELIKFIVYLLEKYRWEHLTVFTDKDNRVLDTTGASFFKYLEGSNNLVWSYIPIYSKQFTDEDYDAKLKEASMTSRVFVLILGLENVRRMMLRAEELSMTSGSYVYIVPEFQGEARITKETWRRNDNKDVKARKAFRSVLFVNVLSPPLKQYDTLLGKLNYKIFGDTFINFLMADQDEEGDEEIVSANDREVQQAILAGYYNSIMVYLSAANETIAAGGNISDGEAMARKMSNKTFEGITGKLHINSEGHRDTDMALVDMTDPWKGTFERVGIYIAEQGELVMKPGAKISWPGGQGPVADIPECGFQDDLCATAYQEEGQSYTSTIALASGIAVLVIGSIVAIILTRNTKTAQRKKELNWWKISPEELQPLKTRTTTKSTFSGSIGQSKKSVSDSNSVTDSTICTYKGNMVKLTPMSETHMQSSVRLLKEFEEIRDMSHPNLIRIIGGCLEGEKPVLVSEYCPKGSLQELLLNDSHFELDLLFQASIINDIVQGLIYIHKRSLKFHGRLTSEVCLIDSRFSVKISDYGMTIIYENAKPKDPDQEKEKLWVAPEHQRGKSNGSQEGDIYSLGIIISEIISREEPFSHDREYLTVREILYKIQFCENPPFRPAITCPPEFLKIETLMKQCWEERPDKRPAPNSVAHTISGLISSCTKKGGGLVDNLLDRLEKYSTNLEKILNDRVDELQQEKHKSEELLKQMLPKMVADKLKAGLVVEPELYDCVTIYFSDIVGFTEMCSDLKPVQINFQSGQFFCLNLTSVMAVMSLSVESRHNYTNYPSSFPLPINLPNFAPTRRRLDHQGCLTGSKLTQFGSGLSAAA